MASQQEMRLRTIRTTIRMTSGAVEIEAPGKVNLILRVLDRRGDGYHNLWSVMQTVELADTVTVEEVPTSHSIALSCEGADLPSGSGNLAYRAAACVLRRLGHPKGVRIQIRKRLPVAAGMGGGSSDAAATVRALAFLFNAQWSLKEMAELGQEIGSDVPFFFYGPTALVQGRGDRVAPLPLVDEGWLVLVNPGIAISTTWAYGQLADARSRAGEAIRPPPAFSNALDSSLKWSELVALMENDFGPVMEAAHPGLRDLRMRLLRLGAQVALLSGSGSTIFGVFHSEEAAKQAAQSLEQQSGLAVWVTRTRNKQENARRLN
jgi:4-diphosphocytidyl-2-C-methyl-D-erythritol kinase